MSNLFLGIAGAATVGKDTYYRLLKQICSEEFGANVIRFALADSLKNDLYSLILYKYGVDIFNCSTEDKNKVRHLLVSHARVMRQNTKGRYWIEKLQSEIDGYKKSENFKPSDIFCVTDIRHFEYPADEVVWLKEENKGVLIYVEKFFDNGSICNPANDDERRNDPLLRQHSDYIVRWKHADPEKYLKSLVKKTVDIFVKEGKLFAHDRLN
jgi:hypothetical protein